eukprot:CAMPEP_0184656696 /NCGR_PEP_ID=MMETSP0308-20130426/16690_1 /TAXON_ID=38269 /ORGANISM="Gloeochaete witrockiana, Strain SAG 46.84" /LENGTH=51 /DNA_ID=CAMNT_0027093939 /DNA_START=708 /DNA_END=860 /DNA_ORIENTATION=-
MKFEVWSLYDASLCRDTVLWRQELEKEEGSRGIHLNDIQMGGGGEGRGERG